MSWIGSQANIFEKQKVREIATLIRDTERHGKAQITNINEGEETQEMLQVTTGQCILAKKKTNYFSNYLHFTSILVKSDVTSHNFHIQMLIQVPKENNKQCKNPHTNCIFCIKIWHWKNKTCHVYDYIYSFAFIQSDKYCFSRRWALTVLLSSTLSSVIMNRFLVQCQSWKKALQRRTVKQMHQIPPPSTRYHNSIMC